MNDYVDGFVIPIRKDKLEEYLAMASKAGAIWKEFGAIEYIESIGDDLEVQEMLPFPRLTGASDDETVVFSWIRYESREHRDAVNAKVIADPRIQEMCGQHGAPFDPKRMAYGGFRIKVAF